MKKSLAAKLFLLGLAMFLLLALPKTVYAEETKITEELIAKITERIEKALEAGEAQADLSDLNIIVNMYSDKLGKQYQKVLDLCSDYAKEHGCFMLGTHREPYVGIGPETEPTDECNQYGVGPNRLTAINLAYESYYCRPDGSGDLELIAHDREMLAREYECALSVVSEEMNDVEKALALYDYIIAVSNYPDVESIDENGIEVYDSESYSALSVFRDHISVCVANATAYCYLLSDCGIPCIRVDSDEMLHSWTMLKVDGAWYHADPTWDNPKYPDGWTSRGDINDDIWDLGAASHYYFLKSDEEMENWLAHYGWSVMVDYTKDKSVKKTPASGPSGSFDTLFFGSCNFWQADVHYNYVNGSWYFLDPAMNRIVKTAFGQDTEKAEYIEAPSDHWMKYVYSSGDCLFISDESGIWRYDTVSGEMVKLSLAENTSELGEPVFTEMNIASGDLNGVVVYNYWSDDPVMKAYSYPVEELLKMEAVPETEVETTTEEQTTEAETTTAESTETETEEAKTTEAETVTEPEETAATSESTAETMAETTEESGKGSSGVLPVIPIVLAVAAVLAGVILYKKKRA